MRICIIGGGLTGLAAAYSLSAVHDVDLLEREPELGGCLSSYHVNGYWIERYYHHLFSGDQELLRLISGLGIDRSLVWLRGTTGYWEEGTCYHLTTPMEIIRYPRLSLGDKVRLAWLTLRSRGMAAERLDSVTAREYVIQRLGERAYRSFFEPLLRSKFGDRRDEVSAAWLIGRIRIRSDRGTSGERLGYLKGGFRQLVVELGKALSERGFTQKTGEAAGSIRREGKGWAVNGSCYDAVLATIPPQEVSRIGGPGLPPIPYQGAACLTLGLDRDVTDGIYWLNMKDNAPYGAVVSHTNFAPPEWYGERIVYLASYYTGRFPTDLESRMLADFCRRFSVPEDAIHWHRLSAEPYAGPVYITGYRKLILPYESHGLFLAGMFSLPNYPERSMEGSIRAGFAAAARIARMGGA